MDCDEALPVRAARDERPRYPWLVVLLAACLSGCSLRGEDVRAWTYPPDFNYVPAERLRSVMWRLGAGVAELDRLLRAEHSGEEPPRGEVVATLQALQAAAQELGPAGWPSNHPRIGDNVGRFQAEVAAALAAARRDPPQYFLAGSLAGACGLCHRP